MLSAFVIFRVIIELCRSSIFLCFVFTRRDIAVLVTLPDDEHTICQHMIGV